MYGFSSSTFDSIIYNGVGVSSTIYFCDSNLYSDPAYSYHCDCPKAKKIRELRATFRNWDIQQSNIAKLFYMLRINEENLIYSTKPNVKFKHSFIANVLNSSNGEERLLAETSPSRVWDWLVSEYFCPLKPPPCLSKDAKNLPMCLTPEMIDDLIRLVEKNHMKMVNDYYYTEVSAQLFHIFNRIK